MVASKSDPESKVAIIQKNTIILFNVSPYSKYLFGPFWPKSQNFSKSQNHSKKSGNHSTRRFGWKAVVPPLWSRRVHCSQLPVGEVMAKESCFFEGGASPCSLLEARTAASREPISTHEEFYFELNKNPKNLINNNNVWTK